MMMRQDGATFSEIDPFSWTVGRVSELNRGSQSPSRAADADAVLRRHANTLQRAKDAKFKSIVHSRRCFYPGLLVPDYAALPMRMTRIGGVALFAVGAVLLVFAYRSSNAPLEQISETMTGRYSNQTMWYLVVGVAASICGGLIALFGDRK